MPRSVLAVWLLALLIGVVAGLRTMTAPTAVSWAAQLGWLDLRGTWLAFLGYAWTPWIMSALAIAELVADQLPSTPSRTVPMQFGARIVSGALSGAAIGAASGVGRRRADRRECRRGRRHTRRTRHPRASRRRVRQRSSGGLHRRRRGDRRRAADRDRTAMSRFDAIIIGAGQAGPSLAGRLTGAGMTVAIVERNLFGGTCVNTGCMPTKTLVASAYAAHVARRAADYGVVSDGAIQVDMAAREGACRCSLGQRARRCGAIAAQPDRLPRAPRGTPASRRRTRSASVTSC